MLQDAVFNFSDGTIRIYLEEESDSWLIEMYGKPSNQRYTNVNRETLNWFLGICQGSYSFGQVIRVLEKERKEYLKEIFGHEWGKKMNKDLIQCLKDNANDGYFLDKYILITS
jgi:hypothetical protein